MRAVFFCFLLLCFSLGWTFSSHALVAEYTLAPDSVFDSTGCIQKDIFDLLTPNKKISTQIPSRKVRAFMIPLIGYSPGTGFQFGAGAALSWPMGKNPGTNLSAGSIQLTWTTERQLIFQVRSNMFLSKNKWFVKSDWRWYIFNNPTFGLGTGPSGNIPEIPGLIIHQPPAEVYAGGSFPMKYNWIKFHNVIFRELARSYYFGLGYHFDDYYILNEGCDELIKNSRIFSAVVVPRPLTAVSCSRVACLTASTEPKCFRSRNLVCSPIPGISSNSLIRVRLLRLFL